MDNLYSIETHKARVFADRIIDNAEQYNLNIVIKALCMVLGDISKAIATEVGEDEAIKFRDDVGKELSRAVELVLGL